MNLPSVKTIESAFPGKGKVIRKLLGSGQAVKDHPAAQELERRCFNPPGLAYMRLTAIDHEAETFGIECVRKNGELAFEYLNTGDSYAATLIRWANGRYCISSWGDIVERGDFD